MAKARNSAGKAPTKLKATNGTSSRVTRKKASAKRGSAKKEPKARPTPPSRLTPAKNTESPDFVVHGPNDKALFTLIAYRGEGMCLLAMNWKDEKPTNDFVGFAIEYKEPDGKDFRPLTNRITFPDPKGRGLGANTKSSRISPFQKFRWIHFPDQAKKLGRFTYRVHPVFMDEKDVLSYGEFQEVDIELEAETYPGEMNICFTRGFISSQAFSNRFGINDKVAGILLPENANEGIDFEPTAKNAETAYDWMGFEARSVILGALDAAIDDTTSTVRVAAYDLNEPNIVFRLKELGSRLKIIIDNSKPHGESDSAETKAAELLSQSASADNIQRQHMGGLQHNKMLVVDGDKAKIAIGGSTNFSWRGLYAQNNNAVVLQGETAVKIFSDAFDNLWANPNKRTGFDDTSSAVWNDLDSPNFKAQVTFSPHSSANSALQSIADEIQATESSVFYSLAFLAQTGGPVTEAIKDITARDGIFVYGLADRSVGGLDLQLPNGNPPIVFPARLLKKVPPPFDKEADAGFGVRMHHKFVVLDFNTPNARVYTGSYNFSGAADGKNGENLFLIRDQRVATSYMIEALAMFDHYEFRNLAESSEDKGEKIELKKPPVEGSGEKPWWDRYWTDKRKQHDRELFGT